MRASAGAAKSMGTDFSGGLILCSFKEVIVKIEKFRKK